MRRRHALITSDAGIPMAIVQLIKKSP
jgi:hypothetical protein